ncbi:MAG: hypothetical protein ACYT04_82090, partial [Nostoc sp.]
MLPQMLRVLLLKKASMLKAEGFYVCHGFYLPIGEPNYIISQKSIVWRFGIGRLQVTKGKIISSALMLNFNKNTVQILY